MLVKPVYEALPAVYITAGVITITLLGTSSVSLFSGILLTVSGLAVLWLRRNYRSSRCEYPRSI